MRPAARCKGWASFRMRVNRNSPTATQVSRSAAPAASSISSCSTSPVRGRGNIGNRHAIGSQHHGRRGRQRHQDGLFPGRDRGQHQCDRQNRLPEIETRPRMAQRAGRRRCGHRENRDLGGPRKQIVEQKGVHGRMLFRISSSSSLVSWSSSTRCSSSGSAAPLNTRSTNSRTMARITCFSGRLGV